MDFGCGTGGTTNEFMAGLTGYAEVVEGFALDISPEMARLAHQNLPKFNVIKGGPDKLNFENKFDLITALFHVVCHLSPQELDAFFQNASKSLKQGGVICFEVIKQLEVREGAIHKPTKSRTENIWHIILRKGMVAKFGIQVDSL